MKADGSVYLGIGRCVGFLFCIEIDDELGYDVGVKVDEVV